MDAQLNRRIQRRVHRGAHSPIKDAVALYQMSLAMRDLGVYTQAIRAMRSSIDALGITDTFSVPPFSPTSVSVPIIPI